MASLPDENEPVGFDESESDDEEMEAAIQAAKKRLEEAKKHRKQHHDVAAHVEQDAAKEEQDFDGLFSPTEPGAGLEGEFPGGHSAGAGRSAKPSLLGLSSTGTTP